MAEIHFITEEVTPHLILTEKFLRSLQHQVTFWTQHLPSSADSHLSSSPSEACSISVYTPFAEWSLSEILAFSSKWVNAEATTFHFIVCSKWRASQFILLALMKALPQHRIYVSVTDEALAHNRLAVEVLLRTNQTLFFESSSSKKRAHEISPKKKWQNWQIINPLIDVYSLNSLKTDFMHEESKIESPEAGRKERLSQKTRKLEMTLILPCEGDGYFLFINKKYFDFLKQFQVCFHFYSASNLSDFDYFSWNSYLSQNGFRNYELRSGTELGPDTYSADRSFRLFTAASSLNSQTLARWMTWAVSKEIPLILSFEQGTLFSRLWQNELNCFFMDESLASYRASWARDRLEALPSKAFFSKSSVESMTNEMVNVMNRIY
jgi:hypothetical protein